MKILRERSLRTIRDIQLYYLIHIFYCRSLDFSQSLQIFCSIRNNHVWLEHKFSIFKLINYLQYYKIY